MRGQITTAQQLLYSFYMIGADQEAGVGELLVPSMQSHLQMKAPHAYGPTPPKQRMNAPGVRRQRKVAARQRMIERIAAEREAAARHQEALHEAFQ